MILSSFVCFKLDIDRLHICSWIRSNQLMLLNSGKSQLDKATQTKASMFTSLCTEIITEIFQKFGFDQKFWRQVEDKCSIIWAWNSQQWLLNTNTYGPNGHTGTVRDLTTTCCICPHHNFQNLFITPRMFWTSPATFK